MYLISYQGVFDFPIPPDELWKVIERPDRFEGWWSWLSDFRTPSDSGKPLLTR